ncbi:MAG: polyribonucleotide nucleotidyltransferase [Parachlamydiales bacterium]|nr:polyribonucleotide nucleotidyltransferase [Parachlamydiales bacterium]
MQTHTISVDIGGKTVTFETGKIARQANGSVMVRQGETMVFASACASKDADPNASFFPLRVDYQEKFSSAGKTLGGFIKREGRPTEREILASRFIDRPIRPMFQEGYYNEVQLLAYVYSYDGIHFPEPMAICAASAALVISDIPLIKPIGAVRVAFIDHQVVVNPTVEELKKSRLDLMLAGSEDGILMVEGHCDFLTEEEVLEAIEKGHEAIKIICHALAQWATAIGKPKNKGQLSLVPQEIIDHVHKIVDNRLDSALRIFKKHERDDAMQAIKDEIVNELLVPEEKYPKALVDRAYKKIKEDAMRLMIMKDRIRCDGRELTQVRPIAIEQNLLPRVHGSSLFTRGETQALAVCTLGPETMAQRYEDLNGEGHHRFYLQYSFPPFSVGEVNRVGAPGRREIGHGKLAERALLAILPAPENFPYTIRLESNIMESNGSSSMASVCGGCLAMMDAGVPIKRPVAGIAMGLILEDHDYCILSDILGIEDALGDMDFKVAGDEKGITSFQMDIKVEGITHAIMQASLAQAKAGRVHILEKMLNACPSSRKEMASHAPRIETMQVKASKIGTIIGPGGKQIRAIIEETGVQIDINDAGVVSIASNNGEALEKAKKIISGLIAEVEVNQVYTGKVTKVAAFGAFVELLPGKEGLCHISELDKKRVDDIFAYIKEGEVVTVKVMEVNDRGQYKLSRKVLM